MTGQACETEALLSLRDLIESRYGLACPDRQLPVLAEKLARLAPKLQVDSLAAVHQTLSRASREVEARVLEEITIGETYFFRDQAQFEALRRQILPDLAARLGPQAPLVVWSAGCATGEEPYSLAMWIRECQPSFWPDRLRILATDINPGALARARAGRYRKWSMRRVEKYWIDRYFTQAGEEFIIDDSLHRVVSFEDHNLVSKRLPPGIAVGEVALALCRNVIIYFKARTAASVMELLRTALMPDGVLVLGHADSFFARQDWRRVYQTGAFYYLPPSEKPAAETPADPGVAPGRARKQPRPPVSTPQAVKRRELPPSAARDVGVPSFRQEPADRPPAELLATARQAADRGDFENARSLLAAYTARDKTSPTAFFLTALVSEQLGDWPEAQDALKKALFLDKTLVMGHYFLAVLHERQGRPGAALKRYLTVCRLLKRAHHNFELPLSGGLIAGRLRELAEARTAELQAASSAPG